jgi:hypothetical protein
MDEKQIERRLVAEVKAAGGWCPKFISPGADGMPDRIVLMPGGRIAFVEVKARARNRESCRSEDTSISAILAFWYSCWTIRQRFP